MTDKPTPKIGFLGAALFAVFLGVLAAQGHRNSDDPTMNPTPTAVVSVAPSTPAGLRSATQPAP